MTVLAQLSKKESGLNGMNLLPFVANSFLLEQKFLQKQICM